MTAAADLALERISKRYGPVEAVRDVTLDVPRGSYLVLLGPSGSGKTTLLSILGGFTAPSAGRILLGGRDITGTSAAARPTATVFQDYALFPHMSVAQNVGFGLSVRRTPRQEAARQVDAALDRVGLSSFGPRRIAETSGGQRQRIALARALVIEPAILLLDEPLGALDLNLRRQMQDELRGLQRREGRTFVHVTHDQEEAMAIADLIVIMNEGRIEDLGPPDRVYQRPRTRFSARFMGDSNILDATVAGGCATTRFGPIPCEGTGRSVAIRPENIVLSPRDGAAPLGRVRVTESVFQGSLVRLTAERDGTTVRFALPPADAPPPGAEVDLHVRRGGAVALAD